MLVHLIAFAAKSVSEVFFESSVGFDNVEIPILDGNITGHFFEYLLVSGLAFADLFLKYFDLSDVGRHLEDRSYSVVFISDRSSIYDHRHILAIQGPDVFFAAVVLTIPKGAINGTHLALLRTMLVHLVAVATFEVPEVPPKSLIRLNYPEIPILNSQVAG
jgi:hypothetical protein